MPHSFVVQMSLAQNRFLEGQKKSPLEPTELIVTVGTYFYTLLGGYFYETGHSITGSKFSLIPSLGK